MGKLEFAPSILSADFARLGEDMRISEQAGADRFHVDVMDGHFVPNITMGPVVVRGIRPVTSLPLDVHLMISNPDQYLDAFAKAGSNTLIPHIEVTTDPLRIIEKIHELGCAAGLAIKPDTSLDALRPVAAHLELVLIMSVHPGFSGQSFIPGSVERVRQARTLLDEVGSHAAIAIDGGVDTTNIGSLVAAGATNIISASAVYRAGIPIPDALRALRAAAQVGSW